MNKPASILENISISVCLASFNGGKYLKEQIDSILKQLQPQDEFLVSDDGSTDDTIAILESYAPMLRLVGKGRVGGVVKNFERVLSHAACSVIVLADQDDVWLPGRLSLIREILTTHDLVMMNGLVVDSKLDPMGSDILNFVRFHQGFARTLIATKYVGCCMAFRQPLLKVLLPFPRGILWHDWYIALAAELYYEIVISSEKTILFRRHESNASITGRSSQSRLWHKISARAWMVYAMLVVSLRYLRLMRAGL